jgi:hypothetical protein
VLRSARFALTSPESGRVMSMIRTLIQKILKLICSFDYLLSTNKEITSINYPTPKISEIFCIVSHSKTSKIEKNVVDCLNSMKAIGLTTVLITNYEMEHKNLADVVVQKGTKGRDLAALRDFVRSTKFLTSKNLQIIYINDSCYWHSSRLVKSYKRLSESPLNTFYFPTQSMYPVRHVQPYFFYIKLSAESIPRFALSLEWIKNYRLKRSLVLFGEYEMEKKLYKQGWDVDLLVNYRDVIVAENILRSLNLEQPLDPICLKYNPTQHCWRVLPKFDIPGVKKSLIISNPYRIQGVLDSEEQLKTFLE